MAGQFPAIPGAAVVAGTFDGEKPMLKRKGLPGDIMVGAKIRSRRMQLGRSQEWLGEQCSLTFQQIQKYEKGANRVGASRLMQIAAALEVSPSFFFEGAPTNGATLSKTDDALRLFTTDRRGLEIVAGWSRLTQKQRGIVAEMVDMLGAS